MNLTSLLAESDLAEETVILHKEVKHIIHSKSNTVAAVKCRKHSWQNKTKQNKTNADCANAEN